MCVGRPWLRVTAKGDGHRIWFRPIEPPTAERRLPDAEDAWRLTQALRHTVRGIRIWGPPGLQEMLASFMDLCGRLLRLYVEIHEVHMGGVTAYQPHPHTLFDTPLEMLCTAPEKPPVKRRRTSCGTTYTIPFFMGRGDALVGKFLVDKALALKIPSGPMFGKLKNGECVTLSDGRVIEPCEVCEPSEVGMPYVILNCQDSSEVDFMNTSLSAWKGTPKWIDFVANASESMILDNSCLKLRTKKHYQAMVELIKEMMRVKGGECVYYQVQKDVTATPYPFVASQALNSILNQAAPQCHRPPPLTKTSPLSFPSFLDKVLLVPKSKWKCDGRGPDIHKAIEEELVSQKVKLIHPHTCEETVCDTYPCLQLLGTGAAQPSKFRNVSSSLIQLDLEHGLLLDCGEGTVSQLLWRFGTSDIIGYVSVVFISHKHADHHMGLLRLLKLRQKMGLDTTIVAPEEMKPWLERFMSLNDRFMACEDMTDEIKQVMETDECRLFMTTVEVHHICRWEGGERVPNGSFGVSLDVAYNPEKSERHSFSICYSGDLIPTESWHRFVSGCDCLIHEATFEDELRSEAIHRHHSTASDALEVAKRAEAKMLVMTHFSQRYPAVPNIDIQEAQNIKCIVYGLDFTFIPLSPLASPDPDSELKTLSDGYSKIKEVVEQLGARLSAQSNEELQ
eukprot:Blabericola_migrator_1__4769@NODE_250_length_10882_cov_193_783819_g211_i0_p1_GENE_NODE_250_length_10882_cov_193_783819_g211_i0NODE_250_length_10882_cov_193_783819_g211_i0_p1_ORF_typecomplete_len676_score162_42Lactamase_B_2/PF12706_7/8_6Lactamase_B_2/PF12706_7/1_3e33Lactamase_B/PF00753_27/3_7e07Lactamase_B_6/PF16661_5/0_00044Lactamase_B_3/PF13483_6/0_00087Epimerase/PF01370_21/0_0563Beta_HSD/PF01073_19/0_24_NODE_250_length_10882_cov_193_783819_g211_i072569283